MSTLYLHWDIYTVPYTSETSSNNLLHNTQRSLWIESLALNKTKIVLCHVDLMDMFAVGELELCSVNMM